MNRARNNNVRGNARALAFAAVAALALLFPSADSAAAEERWEKLENCRLLTDKYMDGDSFHVRHKNKDSIFRLYFVDAPETDASLKDRVVEQAEYWNIRESHIPKLGKKALQFTTKQLKDGFTVYTKWQDAAGASSESRYFGVVKAGKKDLAELLVGAGLARVYGASVTLPDGTSIDTFYDRLRRLESRAKSRKLGAWSKTLNEETAETTDLEDEESDGDSVEEEEDIPSRNSNVPIVAFLRAEAFINMERFEEAEPELKELLDKYPDHNQRARIEFYIALCAAMQERFEESIALFNQWRAEHPDDVLQGEVSYWLPIAMYYGGQHSEALPLFREFAAAYPYSVYTPEAEYRAAMCLYALEEFKECSIELGAWLKKYPSHYFRWEGHVVRGDALAADGRLENAIEDYLQITSEGGPFYYLALTQAAKVYKALGTEQAFRDMAGAFAKFIREMPESGNIIDAAYHAGWALGQAGRLADARKLYWSVVERYGNSNRWEGFDRLLRDLSVLYRDLPEDSFSRDFEERYAAALDNRRLTLASRLSLSRIQSLPQEEQLSAALEFQKRFRPELLGPEALEFLGSTLLAAGMSESAQPLFERIIAEFPESQYVVIAQARKAERLLGEKNYEAALALADAAASSAGDPVLLMESVFARGQALKGLRRFDEALEAFNTVLANRAAPRPMKPLALLALAECMEAQDKAREAIAYYQRIYVMYAAYVDSAAAAYVKSGEAFEKIGDREAAIRTYREMLELESMKTRAEADRAREHLARLEGRS